MENMVKVVINGKVSQWDTNKDPKEFLRAVCPKGGAEQVSIINQIQKKTDELYYVRTLSNGNEMYESEMTSDYGVSVELTSSDTATVQIARDNGNTVKEIKCWLDADGNLDFSKSDWAKWNS